MKNKKIVTNYQARN